MRDVETYPQLAMMVCYHWVFRLEERFLAGRRCRRSGCRRPCRGIRWAMRSSIEEAEYDFYAALTRPPPAIGAGGRARPASAWPRDHYERSRFGPRTAQRTSPIARHLVGAESAARRPRNRCPAPVRRRGRPGARPRDGFVQNQAFACERAGAFYLDARSGRECRRLPPAGA